MSSLMISSKTLLKRKPDMVGANIDGDIVMMGVDQGQYYGITGVGSRVWELLEEPTTLDSITEIICREYDTEKATCYDDMSKFLNDLINIDLVEVLE